MTVGCANWLINDSSQVIFANVFRTYPTPIWISAFFILCVHIQSWPDFLMFLAMRPCTLCEKHKVEPTHKLGLGDFQTLRNADAANGVELHRSVIFGSYLNNRVLLGAVIWIQPPGRYGSTVKVDWWGWRSYFSWSAYFELEQQVATWVPQLLPENMRLSQCNRVFWEKAHLWHECHNPESNEHCLMMLSLSMTVDGFSISWSSLGKWNSLTIADEYVKYLMGETRETSHPIAIVRDGYFMNFLSNSENKPLSTFFAARFVPRHFQDDLQMFSVL